MTRRVAHYFLLFVSATLLGLGLLVGTIAWFLGQGPLHLTYLTPYLEQALNDQDDVDELTFGLGDTVLVWAGWDRRLDVRAVGVTVTGPDDKVAATVPQLSLNLSGRALLKGEIRPTRLEFFGATLNLVRREDGSFGYSAAEPAVQNVPTGVSADVVESLLADLAAVDSGSPLAYLRHLGILNSRITLDDRLTGTVWGAPRADIQVTRARDGLAAVATIEIEAGELRGRFDSEYHLRFDDRMVSANVTFHDLPPALLSRADPDLKDVERLDMSLSGRLGTSFTLDGSELGGELVLRGGAGTVKLPELYPEPLAIAAVDLKLVATPGFKSFDLERLHLDFGGPKLDLAVQLTLDGDRADVAANVTAHSIPAADWPRLWPEQVGVGARHWMTGNMLGGKIDVIRAKASGTTSLADLAAFELADLSGDMAVSGFELHYLRPMPPIEGIGATATFDEDNFQIITDGGSVGDLKLESGVIDLVGLGSEREIGSIDVVISGPVQDVLQLIDSEPLKYPTKLDLDVSNMSGSQRNSLVLQVPLVDAASMDDLVIAAAASVSDFTWRDPLFGPDIENGELTIRASQSAMHTEGRVTVAGSTVNVVWDEVFDGSSEFNTKLELSGQVEEAARAAFGLPLDPYVTGPVGVGAVLAVYPGGRLSAAVQADLTPAQITLADVGWSKPPGAEGEAYVELAFDGDVLTALPVVRARADGMRAAAAVDFRRTANGGPSVRRVSLERLAIDKTSIYGTVEVAEDGATKIMLGGESLDLGSLLDIDGGADEAATAETDAAAVAEPSPPISIEVLAGSSIGRVILSDTAEITDVSGEMHRVDGLWRNVDVQAEIGDGGSITINLDEQDGKRTVYVASDDAGAVMAGLDISDRIYDGSLEITGTIESETGYTPIVGNVLMEEFQIRDAPALATVLSMASFTGILNSLNGDGLEVDRMESDFRVTENQLEIGDAIATGPGLGITTHGTIDFDPEVLDLAGEVAPAYGVNRLLGAIPILGTVLAGESGAVFAATYRVAGPADDISVTVNPLAALAPGSTRKLMRNNEKAKERKAEKEKAAGEDGTPTDGVKNN